MRWLDDYLRPTRLETADSEWTYYMTPPVWRFFGETPMQRLACVNRQRDIIYHTPISSEIATDMDAMAEYLPMLAKHVRESAEYELAYRAKSKLRRRIEHGIISLRYKLRRSR